MKRISTIFLQAFIAAIALAALITMIRMPLLEGRARDLDLFSIYADPLILYVYASSTVFFAALYHAFRLLGYIRQHRLFSPMCVGALRSINHCAVILSILIAGAGLYIRIFHNKDDDPAGFLGLCTILILMALATAVAFARLEKVVRKGIDTKTERDVRM